MKSETFRWLYKHTETSHGKMILSVVLNILSSFSSVYFAVVMKRLIDGAVSHQPGEVRISSLFIVALTIVLYVTFVISNIIQEKIIVSVMSNVRASLMTSLMDKEYGETRKKHSGQWMNLLFSDTKVIAEGSASILPGVAGMLSRLLFAMILLVSMQPVLSAIYLAGGVLLLIGVSLFRGRLKAMHKDVQEKEDALHAFFQEMAENLLIIKVFGAKNYFDEKIDENQSIYSAARVRRRKYRLLSVNAFSFVFRMGYVVALVYGGYQLIQGTTTYGTLTAVLHIVSQIQTPIFNLSGVLPRIYEVFASTERVMETETYKEEEAENPSFCFEGMTVDHLRFSYGRDSVIDEATFDIEKNDIVALTGISGGGKSTLFLLMLGLYTASSGTIYIRTEKGNQKPGVGTRSLFAYVPQGNVLFTGTIRQNVVFNHEFDQERYETALKTADAYDFVMNLPEKDETAIGERGTGLSEGQNQRIAIARAVYSGAPVLLLDESTSALDEETEANVLNQIRQLKDKTVLIVTHRPAALKICSRQIRVEDCKAVEIRK